MNYPDSKLPYDVPKDCLYKNPIVRFCLGTIGFSKCETNQGEHGTCSALTIVCKHDGQCRYSFMGNDVGTSKL